jgi:hypothetical protein
MWFNNDGHFGGFGCALFGGDVAHLLDDPGERTGEVEPLGATVQLAAEFLAARFVNAERAAALASVRTPFVACVRGLQLAIGREQLACDEAKGLEEFHDDGHGLLDRVGPDAVAEVTQIILAGDLVMQTGQCPVAASLLRLVQIVAEAGIVDLLIHFGGHFQDDEARGIVTGTASGARVGRTDRTDEAAGNRGADEPAEAAFDGPFDRPEFSSQCFGSI